jgi:hypothetical protein
MFRIGRNEREPVVGMASVEDIEPDFQAAGRGRPHVGEISAFPHSDWDRIGLAL